MEAVFLMAGNECPDNICRSFESYNIVDYAKV